jgi:mannitol-specific phosphotransferase system IIBC component
MVERERSTGRKVAKGVGIALVVIAAFWGLFAAPVVTISGGAQEAVIGLLILALVFFLVSLPFLYLGRKRKEEIITATTAKKEEEGEEEKREAKQGAKTRNLSAPTILMMNPLRTL